MSTGIWRLAVRSEVSAAHALRNYQGKCEAVHGHNFAVEAVVEGSQLAVDTELLVDFKELRQDLKKVLDNLDHKDLNAIEHFAANNPSSENLAAYIYQALKPLAEARGVRIYSVTVGENSAQSATYMEL